MIGVSVQFDRSDVLAFRLQLQRLRFVLGMTPEDATRVGSIAFLKSMAASTRKGKPRRKVIAERVRRVNLRHGNGRMVKVNNSFLAEGWTKDGIYKPIRIFANSLSEAKASPKAKVRYAGLAKASWGWAQQRLFNSGSTDNVRLPRRHFMDLAKRGRGLDFEVEIDNALDYISAAMQGGRGPALNTAMRRAANVMRSRIDKRITGALR